MDVLVLVLKPLIPTCNGIVIRSVQVTHIRLVANNRYDSHRKRTRKTCWWLGIVFRCFVFCENRIQPGERTPVKWTNSKIITIETNMKAFRHAFNLHITNNHFSLYSFDFFSSSLWLLSVLCLLYFLLCSGVDSRCRFAGFFSSSFVISWASNNKCNCFCHFFLLAVVCTQIITKNSSSFFVAVANQTYIAEWMNKDD